MPQVNPQQTGGGIVFATPAAMISKALKEIGVVGFGRVASPMELQDGLESLNLMLDEWGVLRENISVRTSNNFPLVVGQSIYYIGTGAVDFDTVRPIKIESAFYRDANNSDQPIDCTMQEAEYNAIVIKNLLGTVGRMFYKADWPFGIIHFDYAPMSADTLYMSSWKPFAKITDPADKTQMTFPDGYEAAITYNLAKRLCPPNKKSCPQELNESAMTSLQAIQAAYGEVKTIGNWDMPGVRGGRPSFFDMNGGR